MKKLFYCSDMADECAEAVAASKVEAIVKTVSGGIKVTTLLIKRDEDAKAFQRAKGKYITVESDVSPVNSKTAFALSKTLRDVVRDMSASIVRSNPKILVAGLGNRAVTADALGALVADNLIVAADKKRTEVAAISSGVYGVTGLESADVIRAVAKEINAGLVIAVDTLATSRVQRLYKSFQVTDAGLEPGSASKAGRVKIDYKTIGVPVLAIGVPMCVYTKSLVYVTIDKTDANNALKVAARYDVAEKVLGNENMNMLLTPKDIDGGVVACAGVISDAVNLCFSGETK